MQNPNTAIGFSAMEQFLRKERKYFTKQDIIDYAVAKDIKMVNFRYVANDGKLKALNFVLHSTEYLEQILTTGERIDGSSIFPFMEAGSSDLYVIPKYSTAYMNPFNEEPTLELLCGYFDFEGKPLQSSPEYILRKANADFKKKTGLLFHALGELEYYIYTDKESNYMFPTTDQKGYHEAPPYAKFEFVRTEAMKLIAECGGKIKYGHSEVGSFSDDHYYYEQQEIEFLPTDPEQAVEQMILGK